MSLLLSILLLVFSTVTEATQQIPENLIIKGESYAMKVFPLQSLYTFDEIHKMLPPDPLGSCSANWRGYIGTWEVVNDELMLNSIEAGSCFWHSQLEPEVFFDESNYPVKADWFSGKIEIRLTEDIKHTTLLEDGSEKVTGYEYDIMKFEFLLGDVIYKSKETVRLDWD